MTKGINTSSPTWNTRVHTNADAAAKPSDNHTVPLFVTARGKGAPQRDAHYDWMDFHSIPELSQEW